MESKVQSSITDQLTSWRETVATALLSIVLWAGPLAVVLSSIWSYLRRDWVDLGVVVGLYVALVALLVWRAHDRSIRRGLIVWLCYVSGTLLIVTNATIGVGFPLLLATVVLSGMLLDQRTARLWYAAVIATVFAIAGAHGLGLLPAVEPVSVSVTWWLARSSTFAVLVLATVFPQEYIVRRLLGSLEDSRQHREDLVAGEARFRAIFNSVSDAIFIHDLGTGKVLEVNDTACRLWKCTQEQVMKSGLAEFSLGKPPYSPAEAKEWIAKAAQGEPQVFEWLARDLEGRVFWVEISLRRTTIGGQDRLIATARDIDRRKKTEEDLTEKEQTLSLLLSSISEHFIYQTPDHRILWANKAAADSVGLKPEDLKGRYCYMLWGQPHHECEYCPFHEVMRTAQPYEKEITSPDGRSWVIRGYPVQDAHGNIEALIEVTSEVTDRKRAEEAMRQSEARLRSIFQAAPIGIGMVNDRVLTHANDRLCRMTGYTREELIGRSARILYPTDEDFEYVDREMYGQITEQGTGTVETRWKRKDGSIIDVLLSATPLNVSDLSAGITFAALDITERKRMEAEASQEELRLKAVLRISQYNPTELRNLLDMALEEVVQLSGSQYGYIFHYDEDTREFTVHAWSRAVMQDCSVHGPPQVYELDKTGIWGEAVRQRRPIIVNDFTEANPLKKGHPEGHVTLFRFMTIPVFSQGRIVAVAGVANKPDDYTDSDVHRLTLMMDAVWRTIERKRAEEALRESEAKFAKAFRASPAIMAIAALKDRRLIEVNQAFEQAIGYSGQDVVGRPVAHFGIFENPGDLETVARLLEIQGSVHNVEYDFRSKAGNTLVGLLSAETIELAGQACVLATIVDITERRRLFQQLQQINAELEQRVRERTAVAEDRASQLQVLASRLTTAEHNERRRIAHILHEHFQQLLASAKLSLGVVRRKAPYDSLNEPLRRVEEAIDESIKASRSLTVELCPPILYDMGLAATMEWLGRWMPDKYQLDVDVAADPQANPVAEDINVLLFHSTRELLFNVVKHAHVKRATVRMARRGEQEVEVLVADEGVGFDPTTRSAGQNQAGGFGLFSIRERLELIGGHMDVESKPGHGTRIRLVAPIRHRAPVSPHAT